MSSGADGIFMEVHPNPNKALSDGPNMIVLDDFEKILKNILKFREVYLNIN